MEYEDLRAQPVGATFRCAGCHQPISDYVPVFMLEDRPYCSLPCRPGTPSGSRSGSKSGTSPLATQAVLRSRRNAASSSKLCEMEPEAAYEFARGDVAEVLDLQSGSWVKCRITDQGPSGSYSVEVLDTELAARHGLVGMEANGISPEHLRAQGLPSIVACATSVFFAGSVVFRAAMQMLVASLSLGLSFGGLSLYERLRRWLMVPWWSYWPCPKEKVPCSRRRAQQLPNRTLPEEEHRQRQPDEPDSDLDSDEDSLVANLATSRFSTTSPCSLKDKPKCARSCSARSEASTAASVASSAHPSDFVMACSE